MWLGPDRYRKHERIGALARQLRVAPFDRHEFEAHQCSPADLLTLARAVPAASSLRLIVVDEAHRLEPACLAMLEAHAAIIRQTACVVLLSEQPPKQAQALANLGSWARVEEFSWLSESQLRQRIQRALEACHKRMTSAAMGQLLQHCGADLAMIHAQLDQVIDWAGDRQELTEEDLRAFLGVSAAINAPALQEQPSKGFAIVDAIAQGDAVGALRALEAQLDEGKEIVEVLGLIVWQLERVTRVAHLLAAGIPPGRMASLLGMQAWQVNRMIGELRGRSPEAMRRLVRRCWELDAGIKRGRFALPRLAIEALVLELCQPDKRRIN